MQKSLDLGRVTTSWLILSVGDEARLKYAQARTANDPLDLLLGVDDPNKATDFVGNDAFCTVRSSVRINRAPRETTAAFYLRRASRETMSRGDLGRYFQAWKSSFLSNDVMSRSFVDVAEYGNADFAMELTSTTIGALKDMGYDVNYAAAGAYPIPCGSVPDPDCPALRGNQPLRLAGLSVSPGGPLSTRLEGSISAQVLRR